MPPITKKLTAYQVRTIELLNTEQRKVLFAAVKTAYVGGVEACAQRPGNNITLDDHTLDREAAEFTVQMLEPGSTVDKWPTDEAQAPTSPR